MASAVEPLLRQPATRRAGRVPPAVILGWVRVADAVGVALAGRQAWAWAGEGGGVPAVVPFVLGLAALLAVSLGGSVGAYEPRLLRRPASQAWRLAVGVALALAGTALVDVAAGAGALTAPVLLAWLAAVLVLLLATRAGLLLLVRRLERDGRLAARVVVVGAGEQGQRLVRRLRVAADPDVRLIGMFDDRRSRVPNYVGGYPVLGGIEELVAFAAHHPVDLAVVALPLDAEARLLECFRLLRPLSCDVRLCPDLAGLGLAAGRRVAASDLAGVPLLEVFGRTLSGWAPLVKAVGDRLVAAAILLLTAPLLLAVALAVRLTSPGPALCRQKRYGLNGAVFEILKFRTVRAGACHGDGETAFKQAGRDDPRVTPLGRWLRRTSLDELPQLLNVLRGEMSVVGPRPHAVADGREMAPLVDAYAARRRVKPGITGWAQVNGLRGETDTLEKVRRRLEHDLHYVENWSLSLDLRIILRTFLVGFGHPDAR